MQIEDACDVDKKMKQQKQDVNELLNGIYALIAEAEEDSLSLQKACESLNKRWASVEKRWDSVNKGWDSVEKQWDSVEKQWDSVEKQWDSVEKQWDSVEKRWDSVERQLDEFEELNQICKAKGERLEKQADRLLEDYKELNARAEKYHIDLWAAIIADEEAC